MSSFVRDFQGDDDPITPERWYGIEPASPEEAHDRALTLAERGHWFDLDHLFSVLGLDQSRTASAFPLALATTARVPAPDDDSSMARGPEHNLTRKD